MKVWSRGLPSIAGLLMLALAACSQTQPQAPSGRPVVDTAPLHELDDPLGPARLYRNTFTMATSNDPGGRTLAPIWPDGNDDFNVFERDCRTVEDLAREEEPVILAVRSQEPCPGRVEGLVLAHAEGAGTLGRIWMTVLDLVSGAQWQDERLRIYIDDEQTPWFDATLVELSEGASPFTEPWAGIRSGSFVSYLPLRWTKNFWVTLSGVHGKVYYYQFDLVTGELPVRPRPMAGSEPNAAEIDAEGNVYDRSGVGAVTEIAFEADTAHAERLRGATVTFDFDGVHSAATVGDLCASGWAWGKMQSGRIDVGPAPSGGVRCALRWGWPHGERGRIALDLQDVTGIRVRIGQADGLTQAELPQGRFYVQPATHDSAIPPLLTWVDVQRDGRLAALLVSAEGAPDETLVAPNPFNFLEGDEAIAIDGRIVARGTGTEDLFNGGFYFKDGAYGSPFGGVSLIEELPDGWGRVQMARYFLGADPITFHGRLTATLEIGYPNPGSPHRYRSLAVLYVRP